MTNRLARNVNWCIAAMATLLLLVLGSRPAMAAEPKSPERKSPDLQAVVQELEKLQRDADSLTIVFWFPVPYWEVSLGNNARVTNARKKALVNAFSPYTFIAVVEGKIGTFGDMTFKSEAEVREKIRLLDARGKTYEPLGDDDVQTATKAAVGIETHSGRIDRSHGQKHAPLPFPCQRQGRPADCRSQEQGRTSR